MHVQSCKTEREYQFYHSLVVTVVILYLHVHYTICNFPALQYAKNWHIYSILVHIIFVPLILLLVLSRTYRAAIGSSPPMVAQ